MPCRWRSESEDIIEKLGEESSIQQVSKDGNIHLTIFCVFQDSLNSSVETLLSRLQKMSREKLSFDTDYLTLTLGYEKAKGLEIATAARKPSWNKPADLSKEFYK